MTTRQSDSDSDLCLNGSDGYLGCSIGVATGNENNNENANDSRIRRSSNGRVSIRVVSDERSIFLATYRNRD